MKTGIPVLAIAALAASVQCGRAEAGWVKGDFHQHTLHTDGSHVMAEVFAMDNHFGLDWWANSEHGGKLRWQDIGGFVPAWKGYLGNSWSEVQAGRAAYPDKLIIQGLEWNVPGHEHCSMACIANQFDATNPNAHAVAEFEYRFDAGDSDISGGPEGKWTGKNTINNHAKAVQAVAWLQENHPWSSWAVFAHVERKQPGKGGYTVADFRDFNNAAPDVCFGFESMPGHQRDVGRGGYSTSAVGLGTFGGCGLYAGTVGGLWDALLGEGRHFWLFASSDFHDTDGDYWPGEYQKTYTYVTDKTNPRAIVDGLRSGRSFVVEGDLVDGFEFGAGHADKYAVMGEDLELKQGGVGNQRGNPEVKVTLALEFTSPEMNNAPADFSNTPRLDHVDIIAGRITGPVAPGSDSYNLAGNPTTTVVARYFNPDSGREPSWTVDPVTGKNTIQLKTRVDGDTYFRVRGTNCRIGIDTMDIDGDGNPLSDIDQYNPLIGDAEAWTDLWFYSNPIFVYLDKKRAHPRAEVR